MKTIRHVVKPVSVFLAIFMLLLAASHQLAFAEMTGTETVLDVARGQEARDYLNRALARQEVQTELVAQGIDPQEAKARLNSLSDAEVVRLAQQFEQLPAGGNAIGIFLFCYAGAMVLMAILLVTGMVDVY